MAVVQVAAAFVALAAVCLASPAPPVFPNQWTAFESGVVTDQGQKQEASFYSYFDGINNLTANTNITHSQFDTVVSDYSYNPRYPEGREYFIRTYQGARHCQFWCTPNYPEICDVQDSFCSYDYKHKATFVGTGTFNGEEVNNYFWTENLGPIPMNSLLLSVGDNNTVPMFLHRDVHPFGKPLGVINTTFTDWKAVTSFPTGIFDLGPDAKYACSDPDPSDQCQSEEVMALRRRRAGALTRLRRT
eukprot:m.43209 g.43209  ORF g.43209 m.43209 type:complete len:245 (-) comp12911_c0_seq4:129-863(-)